MHNIYSTEICQGNKYYKQKCTTKTKYIFLKIPKHPDLCMFLLIAWQYKSSPSYIWLCTFTHLMFKIILHLTLSFFSIKSGIFVFRDLIDVIKNESSKFSSFLFLYYSCFFLFFSYCYFYICVK